MSRREIYSKSGEKLRIYKMYGDDFLEFLVGTNYTSIPVTKDELDRVDQTVQKYRNLYDEMRCIPNLIMSAPKSGNHYVRFLVEYISGKKTGGSLGNLYKDKPVTDEEFKNPNLLKHVGNEFIALKTHDPPLPPVYNPKKLIFILRDPYEWENHRKIIPCLKFYHNFLGPKLMIRYEDLIHNTKEVIQQLYDHYELTDPKWMNELLENFDRIEVECLRIKPVKKCYMVKPAYNNSSKKDVHHWAKKKLKEIPTITAKIRGRYVVEIFPYIAKYVKYWERHWRPKIGVCSITLGEKFAKDTKYGRETKLKYCTTHGYDFIEDSSDTDFSRHLAWSKVPVILKYLDKYDYLVWIDADTMIMNQSQILEDYIMRLMGNRELMYVSARKWVNTGVMFIKNTEYMKNFFQEVWKHTDKICWEQGSIDHLWRTDWEGCNKKIKIVQDQREFNSDWWQFQWGQFLVHFPGSGEPERPVNCLKRMMDLFCPLKMEEENDQKYKERIEWLREKAGNELYRWKGLCQSLSVEFPVDFMERYTLEDGEFLKLSTKTFTWWVHKCSGGLGDRLLGLVTSYCIAKELGRDFLIKWDHHNFGPAFKINPKYNFYKANLPSKSMKTFTDNSDIMKLLLESKNVEERFNKYEHVIIWSNMNLFKRFCKSRPHIDHNKHLKEAISILFTKFLQPTRKVNNMFDPQLENSIGIHIRTHDKQFQGEDPKVREPYILKALKACKQHIPDDDKSPIFISSDCGTSLTLSKEVFGQKRCFSNKGPIIHSGRFSDKVNKNGLIRVLLDFLSLSRCKKLYIGWNSNFSRMAALLNPNHPIFTYEKTKNEIIECKLHTLLNYESNSMWRMR